ncbi:MAG: 4Fe-4S binding protein [Crenarchaeota archaeon]|jgi:polyferredoxin|nr:4Fe-4S binding protein [Thermoproteota archaeon]
MVGEIIGDILRLTVLAGLGIAGIVAILLWKKNLATRVTFMRFVIQAVAFTVLFYIFSYSVPMLYLLIAVFGLSLFLGRFFCGWLCPFGLIMDLEIMVRKALKIRHRPLPDKLNIVLHKSRYVILLVFLLLPAVFWILDSQEVMVSPLMAQLLAGHYRVYSVILDPMVPFIVPWSGIGTINLASINFSYPYAQNIVTFIGENIGIYLATIFVVVTLIGGFLIRRVWCRFCPTGASIAAINRFKGFKRVPLLYVEKDEEKCTKCGVCKRVCSVQVNEVYEQKSGRIGTSQCMLCARCVEMCPYEGALKLKLGNKTVFHSRNWLEPPKVE